MISDDKKPEQFTSIRQIGSTGLDYFNDPQDIKDTAVSNALNVVYDRGYPTPRGGSTLAWAKPAGETNPLLCLVDVRASDGTEYAIAVYAPNFYLRDETNNQWVPISRVQTLGQVAITIATPAVFTLANHGLLAGDTVVFSTTGALPSHVVAGTTYYVLATGLTTNTFEISATAGGSAINTTGDSQSGTQTVARNSYTPSSTYASLMYGYANWNAGIGSDVLYCGNGKEDTIRWQIGLGYVTIANNVGDTSITLDDATKFPAVGNIVIQQPNTTPLYMVYTAKTGNVLTVPALVGTIGIGACVTFQISDDASIAKGNLFTTFSGRLIVAGEVGAESTLFGSESGNAENFSVPMTPNGTDPFTQVITDGTGGITGLDNFGTYLMVAKVNGLFNVTVGSTTSSDSSGDSFTYQDIQVDPIASDSSMGPVQPWTKIKKNNVLFYLTKSAGAFGIYPGVTGTQLSIETDIISRPIQPYITTLNFDETRAVAFDQKILWSVASETVSDYIIVYDLLRSAIKSPYDYHPEQNTYTWTRFNNWPVKDWLTHNAKLYYGSRIDGGIYQCFTDTKIDGETPFEATFTTKEFDFGQGALPKTTGKVFVSGYITPNETLYFDMTLTTGNQIITIPYALRGDGNLTVLQIPQALAMMMMGIPTFGMASVTPMNDLIGIFRCYLAVPSRYGFFTLSLTPHSSVNGTDWGFTGIGFSPWLELKAPEIITIGAIGDANNLTIQGGSQSSNSPSVQIAVYNEVPSGSGTTFTVAHATIIDGSERLYRDGSRLGASDYTISGKTITLASTLLTGEVLLVDYLYV